MLTLLILAPVFLVLFLITQLLRFLFFPFHRHHRWNRFNNTWNGPGGWGWTQPNRTLYGYNRRSFGGLGSILFLYALDRLFGRRW